MNEESFYQHPIWAKIENVEASLKGFSDPNRADPRYEDLCKKIGYLKWVLEKSDAALISEPELNSSNGDLQNIANHLANNAKNWQHYTNIENFFAAVFGRFPYPRLQKIFRSEANEAIEQVTGQAALLEVTLEARLAEADNKFGELDIKYSSAEKMLSEVDASLDVLRASVESQQRNWEANLDAKVTNKLSEWTETFSNDEASRQSRSKEKLDEIATALTEVRSNQKELMAANDKALTKASADLEKAQREFQLSAEESLAKLKGIYDQAGQVALAGGFVEAAVSEHKSFKMYSIFAALLMIGSAAILVGIWLSLPEETVFTAGTLLAKLPISAVLLIPAFYLASLASRARRTSLALRSRGLRIKAFDAYLIDSKEPERLALREKLVDEFFMEKDDQPQKDRIFSFGGGKMADITEKIIDKLPGGN
ncbi:hypothetical protein [Octadecabacter ascidiaceicola]|uniref:Uncharacterized protein n=1 Tax=Octadecabacter ascidiaceicola TaxID=1655543 RepID=A0A238JV01_9RHOB|nr:hypothetical protein [Octadecabacter ascidiaceicola]SMX33642.1 hypothetical protein OCA8868_00992 [Octadecabacter ascidiaceicola]